MSESSTPKIRSIIEEAISAKIGIKAITADTFRSDAAAILESLIGEFDENIVLEAMNHQGFKGEAYRSSVRALASVAHERRLLRKSGLAERKRKTARQDGYLR